MQCIAREFLSLKRCWAARQWNPVAPAHPSHVSPRRTKEGIGRGCCSAAMWNARWSTVSIESMHAKETGNVFCRFYIWKSHTHILQTHWYIYNNIGWFVKEAVLEMLHSKPVLTTIGLENGPGSFEVSFSPKAQSDLHSVVVESTEDNYFLHDWAKYFRINVSCLQSDVPP